jgi:ketopantoate reductase
MRFLMFGTGVVGQMYGGFLHRAGHDVTFLTRPAKLHAFKEKGISLVPEKNEPGPSITIADARFIDHLDSVDAFDYVFICTRAEQREEALAAFEAFDCSQKGVVITFPAWRQTLEPWKRFGSCHYMFPGVVALYRGDDVVYKLSKTKIAPLFDALTEETKALSAAMAEAGMPAEMDPKLMRRFQTIMAFGFPVLAAISTHNYNPERFAEDSEMVRFAVQGAKEGLAALKATGEPLAGFAPAVRFMPQFVSRFGLSWFAAALSGFSREMLEVHFEKIHHQTILLLGELVSLPGAETVHHPAIDELLRRAP